MKQEKIQVKSRGRCAGLVLAITVGVMAVIYIGFSIFFQSHFFFGTTLDGVVVGGHSAGRVEQILQEEIANYVLTLVEREDKTETVLGSSIGIHPVFNGEVAGMLDRQNGFTWITSLFHRQELELEKTIVYDEDALDEVISALSCMQKENQRKPVSASCSAYKKGQGYELIPADYGTTVREDVMRSAVTDAVLVLADTLDLEQNGCYAEPLVGDDDTALVTLIEEMNRCVDTVITYEFGENQEVLDGEMISTWLNGQDKKVLVDEEAVLSYVKDLGKKYNTAYQPKEFRTSYGTEITISGGFYGWRIDREGEMAQILEDLKTGGHITREPVYMQTANSHGENDYGDSYVEINLTAQHLFVYKDGELVVESDFVSGDVAKGHMSPTGAYGITYTTTDATLRGTDYATPVKYWMPFAGDVGMHDATWRKNFGGTIYKTNGSHGCINLPLSAAKTIYETVDKGYAVLVYTLPGTEQITAGAQAQEVVNRINGIGIVTLESETAILTARNLYNALSDSAKAYVTNIDVLVQAEAALAQLKAAQTSGEQAQVQPEQVQTEQPPAEQVPAEQEQSEQPPVEQGQPEQQLQ